MKKNITIWIPIVAMALAACSGSKSIYKKGANLQKAGLEQEAANFYIDALKRNRTNEKAIIALKTTGQRVLDDKYGQFYRAYTDERHRDAVYAYLDAIDFNKNVEQVGVKLSLVPYYESYFLESRDIYLTELYEKAENALNSENFQDAEANLRIIRQLDPSFKDVEQLSQFAFVEPRYRMALRAYDEGNYRKSYELFKEVTDKTGGYKESREYLDLSLESAQFTIGMMSIENTTGISGIENAIYGSILREIQNLNDPFIRLVDRKNTNTLLNEQFYNMSGGVDRRTAEQTGRIMGTQAILVGKVISAKRSQGNLIRHNRPGWLGKEVTAIDPVSKAKVVTLAFTKVYYQEFEQENTVNCTFQYQLISTITGEVLMSDLVEVRLKDEVSYASFNGDARLLYSGVWTNQQRDQPNDRRFDTPAQKRELDRKLRARRDIKNVDELMSELYQQTGIRVAAKLKDFNPESK